MKAKLGSRLNHLRQYSEADEQLRMLKRYLSHFVKLLQCGRHFEVSFAEHLQLAVELLNDRRKQPLDVEVLGVIVKTICVISSISLIPHQTVVIALRSLIEIFERISCKETLGTLEFSRNHIQKLVSHFRRFGYYQIQHQLVEIVFVTSHAYTTPEERKDYVTSMVKSVGLSWEQLLKWKSSRLAVSCRSFLVEMQRQARLTNVFSLPVEECLAEKYCLTKASTDDKLWLDINLDPATLHFSAMVTMSYDNKCVKIPINLEILRQDIIQIEPIESSQTNRLLRVNFTDFTVEPNILHINKNGCVVFKLSDGFDWDYVTQEILPDFRSHAPRTQQSLNTTRLEGLLNISLLGSVQSDNNNASTNTNQSLWRPDNSEIIQRHQNIRRQLLRDNSSTNSNKENEAPPVGGDPEVKVENVQRHRVFDKLRAQCQLQRESVTKKPAKRGSKLQQSKQKHSKENELAEKQQQESDINAKKRKLFMTQTELDGLLNESKDSQLQRNKYVEGKLVNTVRPMSLDDIKTEVIEGDGADQKKKSNHCDISSEVMSSEEFEQSLQAYIKNNGIFGIAQQKILDKKLEKNIRIINQMVDRSAKKFFRRESTHDNPYEFVDPDEGTSNQQKPQKGKRSGAGGKRRKTKNEDEEFVPNSKTVKDTSNKARRSKQSSATKNVTKEEIKPSRASLPRAKKPSKFVDLDDSDGAEDAMQSTTKFKPGVLGNLQISAIKADQSKGDRKKCYDTISKTKQNFAKSTPISFDHNMQDKVCIDNKSNKSVTKCQSKKQKLPTKQTPVVSQYDSQQAEFSGGQSYGRTFLIGKPRSNKVVTKRRIPEAVMNSSAGIVLRRDYNKSAKKGESSFISDPYEKENSPYDEVFKSVSENSLQQQSSVTIEFSEFVNMRATKKPNTVVDKHATVGDSTVPLSLQVNTSVPAPSKKPNDSKFNYNYAKTHFLLNKFITIDAENNEANETMQSLDIRVGNDAAKPPSPLEELGDCSVSRSPCYPAQSAHQISIDSESDGQKNPRRPLAEKRKRQVSPAGDRSKRVAFCDISAPNTTPGAPKAVKAEKAKLVTASDMLNQFKSMVHRDLNPSILEMEHKVAKLNKFGCTIERISTNLNSKEIGKKCNEIRKLESRLDGLFNEVVKLCRDAIESKNSSMEFANKIIEYDEAKRDGYMKRVRSGKLEMPVIVNNCKKSIWNKQIHVRLNQLKTLFNNSMM